MPCNNVIILRVPLEPTGIVSCCELLSDVMCAALCGIGAINEGEFG